MSRDGEGEGNTWKQIRFERIEYSNQILRGGEGKERNSSGGGCGEEICCVETFPKNRDNFRGGTSTG